MNRMDEILGPARAIVKGAKPGAEKAPVVAGPKRNLRTYYRRRDGLVTQRAEKAWIPVDGRSHVWDYWDYMDRVDTCRASSTTEAVRIFKNRPTPEGAEPVKDGRHGA